jgi:hypothetical protein
VLAFEACCQDYCKGEIKEIEWQGGPVYLCRAPAATTRRQLETAQLGVPGRSR